jgi:hypothetical protein
MDYYCKSSNIDNRASVYKFVCLPLYSNIIVCKKNIDSLELWMMTEQPLEVTEATPCVGLLPSNDNFHGIIDIS